MSLTISAVSRIAQLTSSNIIVPASSPFVPKSAFKQIQTVPAQSDIGTLLLQQGKIGLISYTGSHSSSLLLHSAKLAEKPVVLHLGIKQNDDLSQVLLLRNVYSYFLISTDIQQAHDHALLAAKLALTSRKTVVHVFWEYDVGDHLVETSREKIDELLSSNVDTNSPASAGNSQDEDIVSKLFKAYELASLATVASIRRPIRPLSTITPPGPTTDTVVFLLGFNTIIPKLEGVSVVQINLTNPLPASRLLNVIPISTQHVVLLEKLRSWSGKWTPLYLDILSAIQSREEGEKPSVKSCLIDGSGPQSDDDWDILLNRVQHSQESRVSFDSPQSTEISPNASSPEIPKYEQGYTKILSHLFGDRLDLANSPSLIQTHGSLATNPEFSLGRVRGEIDTRDKVIDDLKALLSDKAVAQNHSDVHIFIADYLEGRDDASKSTLLSVKVIGALKNLDEEEYPLARKILEKSSYLPLKSHWIIVSSAWSYDLGSSGLHHSIFSSLPINILLLDTSPYSQRQSPDQKAKKDVGLYAMNAGDVYVASVALYSSYGGVLRALVEADRFQGPSVVLAYIPYEGTTDGGALEVLKETKMAVDSGYWPLYRWDPSKEKTNQDPFVLDSDKIKDELKEFLDRQNHLSLLSQAKPKIDEAGGGSIGQEMKEAKEAKAKAVYDELLSSLGASSGGTKLRVLFASDGGNAEKVAKKVVNGAKARGVHVEGPTTVDSVLPFDAFLASLPEEEEEEYVVFVVSTAGQGEPPQNGRQFFKAANAISTPAELPFKKLRYSIFGMGDSHYWPRAQDAHYYNKPGKDLDARLSALGAERVVDLGLGDDQDADGYKTGLNVWESGLWKVLGVDSIDVGGEKEPEAITNEHIKAASNFLRGTIKEGLEDFSTGALSPADTQLTKFHGIYQQDDRDIRDTRMEMGDEPAYSFMIRVRMPGGVCTPRQWLMMDRISEEWGNSTFKITTRATFQFHGVLKRGLKNAIKDINRSLLDTLAACGDVNRNVVCSSIPTMSKLHAQVFEFSKDVSEHLLPRTTAYHEIWLDKKMVAGAALKDFEPVYGEFYLPRKFKIAIAVPPTNDVDVFANDLGLIAIQDEHGDLAGFNVAIGGGMGVTHGNKKTYPRLGSIIGFCTVEQGNAVAEAIVKVQRDNGNRVDRKNARLKYTIDRMGLDVYKAEVEQILGWSFPPARPYAFDRNVDDFGWHVGEDGRHHITLFIENGRVQDTPDKEFKKGLQEIAKVHKGTFRLTTNQHMLISDIEERDVDQIMTLLRKYKLDDLSHTGLRLSSSACVAFPTCGLAMAESERYLPILIDKVEKICEENGLRNDSIVMRMTGCPNGCARPYVAEVAFVGKAPGTYSMLLGGGYYGQRLNKIYRETVSEPEILAILGPMIKRYALQRTEGEKFGDWTVRAGYIAATTEGKAWYDSMGGQGEWKEIVAS